jgi:hypothetical protein
LLGDFHVFLELSAHGHDTPRYVVHPTSLNTLYHAPVHGSSNSGYSDTDTDSGIQKQVLEDVARRRIKFPELRDLQAPVYSSFSGEALFPPCSLDAQPVTTLVERVLDMILTQPVNWDLVTAGVGASLPDTGSIRVLNFGPGTGLLRATERALFAFCFEGDPSRRVEGVDASRDTRADALDTNHVSVKTQEPIAIVGMAVNMPGAPSVRELWQVLQNGINTVEPVRLSSGFLPTPSVLSRYTSPSLGFSSRATREELMLCAADS